MNRLVLLLLPAVAAVLAASFALRAQDLVAAPNGRLVFVTLYVLHAYAHGALAFLGAAALMLVVGRGRRAEALRGALPAASAAAGIATFLLVPWRPVSTLPVGMGAALAMGWWLVGGRPARATA